MLSYDVDMLHKYYPYLRMDSVCFHIKATWQSIRNLSSVTLTCFAVVNRTVNTDYDGLNDKFVFTTCELVFIYICE